MPSLREPRRALRQAPRPERQLPTTERIIQRGMDEGLHSGAQLYVSQSGSVVAELALGVSRDGLDMTTDTLMPWLCCTKLPVAVGLARLYETGELDFEDAVCTHIPEFAGDGREAVTIKHVLTHTSGLAPEGLVGALSGGTWEERVADACRRELDARPGELALYSISSGWYLLGEVIRRVTRQGLRDYIHAAVFTPLRMGDSRVGMSSEDYRAFRDRIGTLHWATEHGLVAEPLLTDEQFLCRCIPGSSGVGPMRELARLLERLLFAHRSPGASPLRPETVALLTQVHRKGMDDEVYGGTFDWGLGVIVDGRAFASPCSVGTFGHTGQETSWAFADPVHEVVVAAIFNGLAAERSVVRREEVTVAVYEDLGLLEHGTLDRRRAAWAAARRQRFRVSRYVRQPGGTSPWASLLEGVPTGTDEDLQLGLEARGGAAAVIERCLRVLCAAAAPPREASGTVVYELHCATGTLEFSLVLADGQVRLRRGADGAAVVRLRLSVADFVRLSLGEMTSEMAWRSGRARAFGDLRLLDQIRDMCELDSGDAEEAVPLPGVPAF